MEKDTKIRSEEEVRQTLNHLVKKYNRLGTGNSNDKKQLCTQIDGLRWFLREA